MSDEKRTVDEPHDRLTRLCEAMTDALAAHPERGEGPMRCVIMLSDGERGGLVLDGYDDVENDNEAIVDLIAHLQSIFAANGKTLIVAPLRQG